MGRDLQSKSIGLYKIFCFHARETTDKRLGSSVQRLSEKISPHSWLHKKIAQLPGSSKSLGSIERCG